MVLPPIIMKAYWAEENVIDSFVARAVGEMRRYYPMKTHMTHQFPKSAATPFPITRNGTETENSMNTITEQVESVIGALFNQHPPMANDLFILGCSTSEIAGKPIGKAGSIEIGNQVIQGAMRACEAARVALCVQCCEHLNRALVIPRQIAAARRYERVCAVPHPTAGGSCAVAAWRLFEDPALVEFVQAEAGMDIGDTLIGMHLRPVAVPFRASVSKIEQANVVMAYTRPKFIGGERARYALEEKE